jgi:DNA-binding response OmpR family regulator
VVELTNGQQGLQHLQEQLPELIILNLKLPDLSGYDVLEQLAPLYDPSARTRVILITATNIDQEYVLRRYPRVVKIFTKPFDINELIAYVHWLVAED